LSIFVFFARFEKMSIDFKRPAEPMAMVAAKRPRQMQLVRVFYKSFLEQFDFQSDLSTGPQRLSRLQGPIMLLNGHEGEIYSAQFSPDGQSIASAGFDMKICSFR
jgi:Prp8 binding protein